MSAQPNGTRRYRLATEESRFTVQAFAEGLFSGFGHNPVIAIREFAGEVECAPDNFDGSKLRVTVKADSLAVADNMSDKDRREIEQAMREQVLETTRYPDIIFESTSFTATPMSGGRSRVRVIGDLTLHGVNGKNIWIQAEVKPDGDGLRAKGEFTLRQTEYNIKPVSVAGGMLKVKNELKFSFDIKAVAD
ncbi:MAG TPA: YceI family protein [Pyrinomonadaceae bacterium]|jgi:polyisoprenoid-binding protein YceI|nr:YceI family protein [Pyrinomonadaceae bacterium]